MIVHFTDKLSPSDTEIPVNALRFCIENILVLPSVAHSPFAVNVASGPLNTPDCWMLPVALPAPKSNGTAPLAMICTKADLTVATGCALANIPVIVIPDDEFVTLQTGQKITLDTESNSIISQK